MRDVLATEELQIPEGVTVNVKSLIITVTGPRGTLTKNVRHCNMDIIVHKNTVLLKVWQGHRKQIAGLRTIRSLINNMIIGVTKGFRYKMRAVYAHFPINVIISKDTSSIEIRNFLGDKAVRNVQLPEGVTMLESSAQKDEFLLEGIDVQAVSQTAASIHGSCLVKKKDIRKFLDGMYVSERTNIEVES